MELKAQIEFYETDQGYEVRELEEGLARKQAVIKLAQSFIKIQGDYLRDGIRKLKPLTLSDLAKDAGVHFSTASQVLARLLIKTPNEDIVFIRDLFGTSFYKHTSGELVSSSYLKMRIIELVNSEITTNKCLSDTDIVKELNNEGFILSRRTIAKYRDELGIPDVRTRKLELAYEQENE